MIHNNIAFSAVQANGVSCICIIHIYIDTVISVGFLSQSNPDLK